MADAKSDDAKMAGYVAERTRLAARLAETGFIWPGTISRCMLTCGKPNCACHTDPASRHGPYAYWTSKKARKTVSRLLGPEEARLLEEWIENRRTLKKTVDQITRLSRKAVKTALRMRARGKSEESRDA